MKLVQLESESLGLQQWLGTFGDVDLVTCGLARTELVRANRGAGRGAIAAAGVLLDSMYEVSLSPDLLDDAALLGEGVLRSLDAIHLAAAQRCGTDLGFVVTYDHRMLAAATDLGMPTATPGRPEHGGT